MMTYIFADKAKTDATITNISLMLSTGPVSVNPDMKILKGESAFFSFPEGDEEKIFFGVGRTLKRSWRNLWRFWDRRQHPYFVLRESKEIML